MKPVSRLKVAFLSFFALSVITIGGGILYLESQSFGSVIKRMISERSPQKLGVIGDFSHLKVYFFPPGLGIANPKIHVERKNIAGLPVQGDIEAKELKAIFAPIQMFSGVLRVDELEVSGGAVQGRIFEEIFEGAGRARKIGSSRLGWEDLFELQIDGVHFVDTYLNVVTELPGQKKKELGTELVVKDLRLQKDSIDGSSGISSSAQVRAVRLELPEQWKSFPLREANQLQWSIRFNERGLHFDPFVLDLSGIHLEVRGKLDGNLLDEKAEPVLSAGVDLRSDLGTFFLSNSSDSRWNGAVDLHASVEAGLKDLSGSLRASYKFQCEDFSFEKIFASRLEAEGELNLAQGRLGIKRLVAAQEKGPYRGQLQLSAQDVPLDLKRPFDSTIEFQEADLHWLGAVVEEAMAPLEGRLQGRAGLRFAPEVRSWRLRISPDLRVEGFELTNQKFGEKRPLKRILQPTLPVSLGGALEVTPKGVDFKDLGLQLKKSQFKVTGGVHGSSGFDLSAKGPVDMKEVSEIAGSPIRGEGTLEARIHGTADALLLDFDPQLQNASYLDLKLGNLKGRVTYDDGISELRFTDVKANQRNTFYSLREGFVDLSGSDELHLPIEIHSGKVEDLGLILDSLTRKISWYPGSLKGEVHGKVDIGGKVDLPKMSIAAHLEGSDWNWMGERSRRVRMNLGYDRGLYYARDISILKSGGAIKGRVSFQSATDEMEWDLRTEGFSLNDIDFIDRLQIPARSRIEIQSAGGGKTGQLKSTTLARGYDTEIKGEQFAPSRLNMTLGESQLRAEADVFGGQLTGVLKYSLIPRQPSSIRLDLSSLDFSPLMLILNPRLVDDPELLARVSGHLQLDFLSTQGELSRGELDIHRYELRKTGFQLRLAEPVLVPVQLGYFQIKPARFRFNQSELTITGEGKKGEVDLQIHGDADLALAEMITPAVRKAQGKMRTDIQIRGPLKELQLDGELRVAGGKVLMSWVQSPLEDLESRIHITRGRIFVESLDAFFGGEIFNLIGKIDTFTDRFPELDLRASLSNNKVKMDPFEQIQARGNVSIRGDEPPYKIGGNLDLTQALYNRGFSKSSGGGSRGDRFMPRDPDKQLGANLFELDLHVNANQGFFVRNEIMDAEFRGKAHLIGPPDSPKLLGEGRLVQGKVLFKDRPFAFESVKIEFDDPYQFNPKFDAAAVCEVNQYKIRVTVSGSSSQWKAEFSSTPYLRENEIFTVLSSGSLATGGSRFNTRDRSLVNQGEAASLILHSMDFSKDVQSKTGFQFDVEEAVDTQAATSVFRPQNLSENMAAPKVVLKRNVGKNTSLSFGSTVGVGSRNVKEINAEYKLSPGMSALGVWNNIEGVNTRESRTSFGLDLKFDKKFK